MASPPIGVDTVRVRGKATLRQLTSNARVRYTSYTDAQTGVVKTYEGWQLDSHAYLQVRHSPEGEGIWAAVEASAPRIIHGHNLKACSLEEARGVIQRLYEEASAHLDWHVSPVDLQVSRIDLVRDFVEVEHLPTLIDSWARYPAPRERAVRSRPRVLHHPALGGRTFYRGNTSSRYVAVYDKHGWARDIAPQWLQAAPVGLVRYEARYRSPALQRVGVVRAEDLREPVLEGARRGLWDHYGLGSEVALASAVFQRIYDSDLKPMLKRNICWWLLCALQGVDAKLGRDLRADVRRACREMGLTPDVGLDAHLPKQPVLVRLDYDQGAQVTTAVPPPTTGEYLASIVQKSA